MMHIREDRRTLILQIMTLVNIISSSRDGTHSRVCTEILMDVLIVKDEIAPVQIPGFLDMYLCNQSYKGA